MNSLPQRSKALTAILLVASAGTFGCASLGSKPSQTVKQVMESGFKGKESVAARIGQGTSTAADRQLMVELTRQLTLNKAPMGDLASWSQKTAMLHAAAKNVAAGNAAAADQWKAAVNCKACHSAHKPE